MSRCFKRSRSEYSITIFRKENGELHHEQLFGTVGFDGMSSLLYHLHPPTIVKDFIETKDLRPKLASERQLQMKSFEGYNIKQKDDFLDSRVPILVNNDCEIILSRPKKSLENYFYKNAEFQRIPWYQQLFNFISQCLYFMTGPKFVVPILGIVKQNRNLRNQTKKYPDIKLERKEHDLVPDLWLKKIP